MNCFWATVTTKDALQNTNYRNKRSFWCLIVSCCNNIPWENVLFWEYTNLNLAVLTCMLLGFSGFCRCVCLWVLSDGPHFVCLSLSCSLLNTNVFTFTLLIIKCYHILHMHMYSIWDLLKTGMSYCPLWYQDNLHMCLMYSLMYASIIKNVIWYLRGKCNSIFYSDTKERRKRCGIQGTLYMWKHLRRDVHLPVLSFSVGLFFTLCPPSNRTYT